jgi:hypothetical protein
MLVRKPCISADQPACGHAISGVQAVIPPRPPVALPSDLATALRYLEDTELQRLQAAVAGRA